MRSFYIDGTASSTYNIYASGENAYDAPERDVEVVEVPGRNGNIILDNGRWKNIDVVYPCIVDKQFLDNAAAARVWLLGDGVSYRKITDDYNTDSFRMGRYKGGIEYAPMFFNKAKATLDVTFDCRPERFLNSGETWATNIVDGIHQEATITNPTNFEAKPLLYVEKETSANAASVEINGKRFTLDVLPSKTAFYVDCETMKVYYNDDNRISAFSGDFPVLAPGSNTVKLLITPNTGNANVSIKPRWWTL